MCAVLDAHGGLCGGSATQPCLEVALEPWRQTHHQGTNKNTAGFKLRCEVGLSRFHESPWLCMRHSA